MPHCSNSTVDLGCWHTQNVLVPWYNVYGLCIDLLRTQYHIWTFTHSIPWYMDVEPLNNVVYGCSPTLIPWYMDVEPLNTMVYGCSPTPITWYMAVEPPNTTLDYLLIQPLADVDSNLCAQRFGENNHISLHCLVWPGGVTWDGNGKEVSLKHCVSPV